MNPFILQSHIKFIKSDSKDIYKCYKTFPFQIIASLELYSSKNLEKAYHGFHKNMKQ